MEWNTSAAELKRLINSLLNKMDKRQLRVMYAHANRVYCAGGQTQLLQRASRQRNVKTGGNDRLKKKTAQNAK